MSAMKGVGRIYQQTFIDTYTKVVFAKLYDRKTPITAAEILNDRVLLFFEEHGIVLCRVLTDRGTEYCGNPEHHDYELYLAVEDIDHTRTKTKSPQTNGICERFHRTVLDEFYRVAFRKKIYRTIDELQNDLDVWVTAAGRIAPDTNLRRTPTTTKSQSSGQVHTFTAHFLAGRYEMASSCAEKAMRDNPIFLLAICISAASNALAGRLEPAKSHVTGTRM